MTPQEMEQLYTNLAAGLNSEALKQTNAIGAAAAAKGPSLGAMNTGGNGIGSYNYNRLVAPQVNQMRDQLVSVGKQYAFKQGIADAFKAAQDQYSAAARSYQARQAAKAAATVPGGGGSGTPGSVSVEQKTQPTTPGSPTVNNVYPPGSTFDPRMSMDGITINSQPPQPVRPLTPQDLQQILSLQPKVNDPLNILGSN